MKRFFAACALAFAAFAVAPTILPADSVVQLVRPAYADTVYIVELISPDGTVTASNTYGTLAGAQAKAAEWRQSKAVKKDGYSVRITIRIT